MTAISSTFMDARGDDDLGRWQRVHREINAWLSTSSAAPSLMQRMSSVSQARPAKHPSKFRDARVRLDSSQYCLLLTGVFRSTNLQIGIAEIDAIL